MVLHAHSRSLWRCAKALKKEVETLQAMNDEKFRAIAQLHAIVLQLRDKAPLPEQMQIDAALSHILGQA